MQVAEDLAEGSETAGIEQWAGLVIKQMGEDVQSVEVCIRLVGEAESERLNTDFRQQNKPTNVLSFPADISVPDSTTRYLGDMVICEPVVQREALEQSKGVEDHLAHMVVHGMLHLYGHDHIEPGEADVMENIEREILGKVGIADPYRQI